MKEIKLSVDEKNLDVVMGVLNALQTGLISKIEVDGVLKPRTTRYQPSAKAVDEKDSGPNDRSGKYVSAAAYKARLKKNA